VTIAAPMLPVAPPVVTPTGLARVRFRAMGTTVEVLLPEGRDAAASIVVAVFDAWERRCSRFVATSELSRLNASAGAPVVVSRGLHDAIAVAMDAARATDGVFDPTVLRRLEALGYDRTFDEIAAEPAGTDAEAVPAAVDRAATDPAAADLVWSGAWWRVLLDRSTRTVELPVGVGLDLGGIAKGMAVDAAVAALSLAGIDHAAVNAGGDLAVLGTPPGADAWWIGVETYDGGAVVALERGALATSSTANRRWTRGGRTLNHLVDPRTGSPAASGLTSVSVSAHTCAQAEVAAKTTLMLGIREGSAFLDRAGLSALVVDDAGVRTRIGRWVEAGDARPRAGVSLPHPGALTGALTGGDPLS
jgi:thiamine biosynthesis lipoprotein